ncbi:MAG: MBL fold metallo-hydrolase [Actinomycetota bacterium]|nr:MBL fold metallo-hydrolase [Actinomycetota bacterium]
MTGANGPDRLYFRQLLAGRDFAQDDAVARQMVNFVYAIGDRCSREALLVDPAYRVDELLGLLAADEMRCSGVLATHYHFDHVGGSAMGWDVEGISTLLERVQVPIHVQRAELPWVVRATGVGGGDLTPHEDGDVVSVGAVDVELVHTPGHTPGSQCFLVEGKLVSGDTLFLQGCGRTDLPGGDPEALYDSLTRRLAKVPDDTLVYPGHSYSDEPSATMGETRRTNVVLRPRSAEEWLAVFGG